MDDNGLVLHMIRLYIVLFDKCFISQISKKKSYVIFPENVTVAGWARRGA